MKRLMMSVVAMAVVAVAALLVTSISEGSDRWIGTVIGDGLNVRTEPNTQSDIVMTLGPGEKVVVTGEVKGEAVFGSYSTWYRTKSGYYVYARYVARQANNDEQTAPVLQDGTRYKGQPGRWLDADLSRQVLTAMVGDEPVYGAEITIGRPGWETPTGRYTILNKVYNDTMDSATIGIPRDSPEGYYLTNVLYTQFYTNRGHAIHYNYWVDPDAFGHEQTSRGCLGLRLADAKFFWDFTDIGTPLIIHH